MGRDGVKRMVLKTPLSPTHIIDYTLVALPALPKPFGPAQRHGIDPDLILSAGKCRMVTIRVAWEWAPCRHQTPTSHALSMCGVEYRVRIQREMGRRSWRFSTTVDYVLNRGYACASLAGYTGRHGKHDRGHYTEDAELGIHTTCALSFPSLMPYGIRPKLAAFGLTQRVPKTGLTPWELSTLRLIQCRALSQVFEAFESGRICRDVGPRWPIAPGRSRTDTLNSAMGLGLRSTVGWQP